MLVRELGRRLHVFDDAEEVRRLHDHRGGLLVELALRDRARSMRAGLRVVAELLDLHALVARVGVEHLAVLRVHGARRPARASRPVMRTAIMAASGTAVEPSYMEALATSMPVSWQIMVWNSKIVRQRALRDLGLVGRVGGEELAARDHRVHQHRAVVADTRPRRGNDA